MTCLILLDVVPIWLGTALLRAGSLAVLFFSTVAVSLARVAASGSLTVESRPLIMEPEYWFSAVSRGSVGLGWPGPLFGPAPSPLAEVMLSLPSWARTCVGYQPVGMSPITLRVAALMTATSLCPELVT